MTWQERQKTRARPKVIQKSEIIRRLKQNIESLENENDSRYKKYLQNLKKQLGEVL
jgi:hypothetical protein